MSYELARKDIDTIFALPSWTDNSIKTYPRHGAIPDTVTNYNEYVVVGMTPTSAIREAFGGKRAINGLYAVEIFIQGGRGDKRVYEIADLLDTILQNQFLNNRTQTGVSYINNISVDESNPILVKAVYALPFTVHD